MNTACVGLHANPPVGPALVPSVGFVHSRFKPGAAAAADQFDGARHARIKRSRTAAVLDYFAAGFVLTAVVFGPVLGWLILE